MNKNKQLKAGEKQRKVGKGVLPVGTQFKKGQSGNPAGYKKGVPNRSTIARKVLEMVGVVPDQIFATLIKMYPQIEKTMTIEEIMTITMTHRAIVKGDTSAYKAVMDSRYGTPAQTILGKDGGALEVDLTIKKSREELMEEAAARGLPTTIFK